MIRVESLGMSVQGLGFRIKDLAVGAGVEALERDPVRRPEPRGARPDACIIQWVYSGWM